MILLGFLRNFQYFSKIKIKSFSYCNGILLGEYEENVEFIRSDGILKVP